MFSNLSNRLKSITGRLSGRGRLTEDNIREAVRDVRRALLEADVALPVVKTFIAQVSAQSLGEEVGRSLSPGQAFLGILQRELTATLGGEQAVLELRQQPPAVLMLVGLQGAGKTTTAAKLARYLSGEKRRPMLASLDTRRPAAVEQLRQLADRLSVPFFGADAGGDPVRLAEQALSSARTAQAEVLILDTAGRTRLESDLLQELRSVHDQLDPAETLFVVDSMAGQDAVNAARAFADAVALTGVILTKTDGDARGGAALSVKSVTGRPIKFAGTGEKIEDLEPFVPERAASRILGMGDLSGLLEDVRRDVDVDQAKRAAGKLRKGKFDFKDLKEQMEQMQGMGGIEALLNKLPLPGGVDPARIASQADSRQISRQIAIINSMTPAERRQPRILNGSRKRRIAAGAGLQVQDVNRLIKQHTQMQKMMKKLSKGGLRRAMRGMGGLGGM